MSLQNKVSLRQSLNEKRAAVNSETRSAAAHRAAELFIKSPLFSAQHIACYLARDVEFDCTPIIHAIWQAKKHCYLPVLSPNQDQSLDFVAYHSDSIMRLNRYRILEPEYTETFPAHRLDLVLMPLVGFDLHGNRLGMGGGYYDRTFAFLRDKSENKPQLIGVAYECQHVDVLPGDSWDVPLDGIVTEERIVVY